jgi:hypothetical protein
MAEVTHDQSDTIEPAKAIEPTEESATTKRHVDKQLDHGLDETFPASDPVSINPGSDWTGCPSFRICHGAPRSLNAPTNSPGGEIVPRSRI